MHYNRRSTFGIMSFSFGDGAPRPYEKGVYVLLAARGRPQLKQRERKGVLDEDWSQTGAWLARMHAVRRVSHARTTRVQASTGQTLTSGESILDIPPHAFVQSTHSFIHFPYDFVEIIASAFTGAQISLEMTMHCM